MEGINQTDNGNAYETTSMIVNKGNDSSPLKRHYKAVNHNDEEEDDEWLEGLDDYDCDVELAAAGTNKQSSTKRHKSNKLKVKEAGYVERRGRKPKNGISSANSFKEAARIILRREKKPMSAKDITEAAIAEGLITTQGKTPQNTLAALIYTDMKENESTSVFKKVSPGTFSLKSFV